MATDTKKKSNRPATYEPRKARKEALDEAIENLAYWRRRAVLAINPLDKVDCLARVSVWKSTRDARRFAAGKEVEA